MRWTRCVFAVLLTAALLAVARSQEPDQVIRDCVVTDNEAFVALPAEVIAGPEIGEITPSPEGDYILIQRVVVPPVRSINVLIEPKSAPPRGEFHLLLWSAASRRTLTVWRAAVDESQTPFILSVRWLPKSRFALVTVGIAPPGASPDEVTYRLMRVDALSSAVKTLATMTGENALLVIAPDAPIAALVSPENDTVRLLGNDGAFGRTVAIAEPKVNWVGWMPGGKELFGIRRDPVKEGQKRTTRRFLLDPVSGAVIEKPDAKPPTDETPGLAATLPFRVKSVTSTLSDGGTRATVHPLWLEGVAKDATGKVLVAPDGEQPLPLPGAVVYQRRGVLYATPLLHMNKAQFLALRQAALKRQTMSNAKQVGLALLMYCQDYDENFPPPGEGVRDVILPYIKNADAFNNPDTGQLGLELVYKQMGLAGYQTPATTVLGYLNGPNGRAAIYVDGHVKWEDSPGP
jgi:hypothetical protein